MEELHNSKAAQVAVVGDIGSVVEQVTFKYTMLLSYEILV